MHERIAERAGLPGEQRFQDRSAAPPVSSYPHLQYVGNFVAFALSPGVADDLNERAQQALTGGQLPVHDIEGASSDFQVLGWHFDGQRGLVRGTARRVWRIIYGTRALLALPQVTGKQVAKLVGHFSFLFLIRRPLLACFDAVYRFMRRARSGPRPLWPSARRELEWAVALVPSAGPRRRTGRTPRPTPARAAPRATTAAAPTAPSS